MNAKDARAEVIAKAMKDAAFRAELKKDPAAAIAKATGMKLPAGVSIKVVEDSASVVHLVLPSDDKGLSEADLQKVAGGSGTLTKADYCDSCSNRPLICNAK